MKNKSLITLLLTLIVGLKQTHAQFYNQGAEVTIQVGATVTVEGDFYNSAASNFKNAGTIEIKNYVTNDQPMTNDFGGYWIFNGSSGVKIGGNEMIWMNTLNINNPGGFILQNSLRISKQMEFNAGIMTAENPGNIVLFTKNGGIGSPLPSNTSHINGEVVKEGETQTFKYPLGDGTKYQPIEVDFTTNENGLLGKYNPTDAGSAGFGTSGSESTPLISYNTKEHWDLTPINGGSTKATVKVFWDSYNDGFSESASLRRVAHLSPITNKWENEGTNAGIGTPAAGSVVSNTIADWSPFTLGTVQAVALPVRLISFTGKKVGENNVLNWKTTEEKNASHFEIERSSNAKEFEKIGKVLANNSENHQFYDNSPFKAHNAPINFYRLKMVDHDGHFDYSKIISITNDAENESVVGNFYPNPVIVNKANIEINNAEKTEWEISTIDIYGKVLKSDKRILEKGKNILEFENFQKGLNLIRFESNSKVLVRKLIR